MTAATIAERVAAGAAWLDEHKPGWDQLIDLGRLDMSDSCLCVLGQVYESAARAFSEQFGEDRWPGDINGFDYATDELKAPQYDGGFAFTYREMQRMYEEDSVRASWAELGTEWKRLIAARRAGESR